MDNESVAMMRKFEETEGKYEILMKQFIYIFIIDLGISPFIKCYKEKNFFQACIISEQKNFLQELLSHIYEVYDERTLVRFKQIIQTDADVNGQNLFHEIFMLEKSKQAQFLEMI